jgi:two-component system nitrate/nitrite response regulator NarL
LSTDRAATEPVRLALIDDHGLCRKGLAELLWHRAGIKVVGATGDPDEAIAILREHKPHLAIMDLRMPAMPGLALMKRLREEGIDTPVLILTMCDSQEDLAGALRAGARGYLLVAPAMAVKLSHLLGAPRSRTEASSRALTDREVEILAHIAQGMSNKGIAKALDISHDTVKLHVRHILAKLNVSSRVEAAVYAVERKASTGN